MSIQSSNGLTAMEWREGQGRQSSGNISLEDTSEQYSVKNTECAYRQSMIEYLGWNSDCYLVWNSGW